MPTSARWEAAKSPEIPVQSVYSAGGQSRPPLRSTGGSETLLQGSTTLSARLGSCEFAEEFCKNGLFCAGRCRHRPLQPNAHVPADSPKISEDSVRPAGRSGPAPTRTLRLQEKRPEFQTQGEEILRGTTCVPGKPGAQISVTGGPGGAYCAFGPAARRRRELRLCGSLHQPLPLCGAARSSFLFSACIGMGN